MLAAYAPTAEALIAARALLGVAGATLMPSTLALISTMFRDPTQRSLAIAVWMTTFSAGVAAGPVIGGVMLDLFWWGAVFLLGVPVMVLLLVLGPVLLPEHRDPEGARRRVGPGRRGGRAAPRPARRPAPGRRPRRLHRRFAAPGLLGAGLSACIVALALTELRDTSS